MTGHRGAIRADLRGEITRFLAGSPDGEEFGLAFQPGQEPEIARLAVALFHPAVPFSAGARREMDDMPTWETVAA